MQGRFRQITPDLLDRLQQEIDSRRREILAEAGGA
jgi:hypothetical protein